MHNFFKNLKCQQSLVLKKGEIRMCCKYRFLSLIFLVILFISAHIKPVVIFVNGTLSDNSLSYSGDKPFLPALRASVQSLGKDFYYLSWSGVNTKARLIHGAKKLASKILSYPEAEEIIVIGHDHGANVITMASNLLKDGKPTGSSIADQAYDYPLNQPTETATNPKGRLANRCKNPYTETYTQYINTFLAYDIDIIDTLRDAKGYTKTYLIDQAYLINPIIYETDFKPNMEVINNLYSFYSLSNTIYQTLINLTTTKFTKVNRLVNFKMTENSKNMILDEPLFATWLLKIPIYLHDHNIGNFENYISTSNGLINFVNSSPIYNMDN
jgi:hypothetical protein